MGGAGADSTESTSGVPTNPEAPRAPAPEPGELPSGRILAGRYEVRGLIGAGGMGAVYRVLDRELREEVALKVLRHERLGDGASVERFRREVRLARRIGHPNVCRVFDLGEVDGLRFLTMEWVEGRSLRAVLRQGRPPPSTVLGMFVQIVAGVAAAHELGIIHRDLKPENILIRADGRVKVADFGLALATAGDVATSAGAGTPQYMSPEQLRGEAVGPASDVFALGIVGHEIFTGRSPFGEGLPAVITSAILRDPPRAFDAPGLPPEVMALLAGVLTRALEKRPEARFADAGQLAREMAALQADPVHPAPSGQSQEPPTPGPLSQHSARTPAPVSAPTGRPAPPPRRWIWPVIAAVAVAALFLGGVVLRLDPAPPTTSSSSPAAPPSAPVPDAGVRVLDFEDLAREPAWEGLAAKATAKARDALRNVPGVKLLGAGSEAAEVSWIVRGEVHRVGDSATIAVWFERGAGQVAETVEVDGPGAKPAALLDRLRAGIIDEARLLARDHRRRAHVLRDTASIPAREKLLAYYDLLGLSSRPPDLDAGVKLLESALQHDPACLLARIEYAELVAQRAGARGRREDLDDALALIASVLAASPGDPRALAQQCRYRRFVTLFEPAVTDATLNVARESCDLALVADRDSAAVLLALAKLDAERCDDAAQADHLNRALAVDRARAGEILPLLVTLALQGDHLELADGLSAKLVDLQLEEERLGPRALSRRAGVDPAQGAFLLRGGVLLRRGLLAEAREAFEEELDRHRSGPGAAESGAAALYGLSRVAAAGGGPVSPDRSVRLRDIESRPRAPEEIEGFVGEIAKVSPEDALPWLARLGSPSSCNEAIQRAYLHISLGDRAAASRALAVCERPSVWESECVTALRGRLSR